MLGMERMVILQVGESMQQRAGIFGYPLSHSISPAFQQAAFDHHALPATYDAWPVAPEGLPNAIAKLYGDEHLGANVTVPHKEAALELMDEVDPVAQRIGAVNTIVRRGDRLVGYNTDLDGFVKGLKSYGGFEPGGKRALLLGAGGAARAAAFGLVEERVASLTIANRTVGRAESLAREVSGVLATVSAIGLTDRAVASAAADCDLIVHSTSIGMSGGDGDGQTPVGTGCIRPDVLVYDLVYNPVETPLMREARRAGASVLGGLPMLVYQGAAAFELFTDRAAPIDVMFDAAERAMASR